MLYKDIIIHCPKQTSSGTQQWGSGRDTFLKNDKAAMILEKKVHNYVYLLNSQNKQPKNNNVNRTY